VSRSSAADLILILLATPVWGLLSSKQPPTDELTPKSDAL
jgi:hypothetical protein